MSDYIELPEVKIHLRVLHTRDDSYIELLTKAAFESVENFIDRPLVELKNDVGEIPRSLKQLHYLWLVIYIQTDLM